MLGNQPSRTAEPFSQGREANDSPPGIENRGVGDEIAAREARPLSHFQAIRDEFFSDLSDEELIAGRLYTGPMFKLYGQFKWAPDKADQYKTTVHAINSCITKLAYYNIPRTLRAKAHANGVEFDSSPGTLYRGVCGTLFSPQFLFGDTEQRGGVCQGFQSFSRKRSVAEGYALNETRKQSPEVKYLLVVEEGMCDRGADVTWLSQYPGENEKLLGPLAAMQVVCCKATKLADLDDSTKSHDVLEVHTRYTS